MYDFEGDTENGELVINEGEEVIVLNQVSALFYLVLTLLILMLVHTQTNMGM